jgi:hypothetical protein
MTPSTLQGTTTQQPTTLQHFRIPLAPLDDQEQAWIDELERLVALRCEALAAIDHDGVLGSFVSLTVHLLGDFLWDNSAGTPRWGELDVVGWVARLREHPGCDRPWLGLFAVTAVQFFEWLAGEQEIGRCDSLVIIMAFERELGPAMADLGYRTRYRRGAGHRPPRVYSGAAAVPAQSRTGSGKVLPGAD